MLDQLCWLGRNGITHHTHLLTYPRKPQHFQIIEDAFFVCRKFSKPILLLVNLTFNTLRISRNGEKQEWQQEKNTHVQISQYQQFVDEILIK